MTQGKSAAAPTQCSAERHRATNLSYDYVFPPSIMLTLSHNSLKYTELAKKVCPRLRDLAIAQPTTCRTNFFVQLCRVEKFKISRL